MVIAWLEAPQFWLQKIEALEPGGGISYRDERRFGAAEWRKVVEAKEDFGVIGIDLSNTFQLLTSIALSIIHEVKCK